MADTRPRTYADLTRDDPNPVKRWLQRRRLADATRLVLDTGPLGVLVDYGAGDGALAAAVARALPGSRVICFEPNARMRVQAEALTQGVEAVEVVAETGGVADESVDLVISTEVFEHLPVAESDAGLAEIARMLVPGGTVIFGVPVEVGPPALAKGLFRMVRRPTAPDGRPGRVLAAAVGRPPERVASYMSDGRPYHFEHLGFDHRRFEAAIAARFEIVQRRYSPFGPVGGSWLNSELYVVARRR